MSQKEENKKLVEYNDDWEDESEHDPYSTDSGSEFTLSDEERKRKRKHVTKKGKAKDEESDEEEDEAKPVKKSKSERKKGKNGDSHGAKKSKKEMANEDKIKLASIVQEEEIIYNLQHKLHSNSSAMSAAWKRVATKMDKSGNYFPFFFLQYYYFGCLNFNSIINVVNIVTVGDCKKIYRSCRDAVRYRQKKITGKSGDSGDENMNDDSIADDWELKESLSFLTPTSSRFARKTMVIGAGQPDESTFDPLEDDLARERVNDPFRRQNDQSSQDSVYSYVSILFYFFLSTFVNMCVCLCTMCYCCSNC